MSTNYNELAHSILGLVGGKDNVKHVLHCATRLRFNLKDEGKADEEGLKKLSGVLGLVKAGGQLQVVIGPDVYDEVCAAAGLNQEAQVADDGKTDKSAGQGKKKYTVKGFFMGILDALSGSLGPAIPVITACAFFKMLTSLLGPDMLAVLPAESDLYVLFTFVGDAGFYFFPVIIGYTAAKKFNVMPVLGILLGCIMMHPTFVGLLLRYSEFPVLYRTMAVRSCRLYFPCG